jgi:flagellar protein FlaF
LKRILQYASTNEISVSSAQEGEIMAFSVANTYLTECSDSVSRIKALHKNQQLWSLLVKDVMLGNNRLPQPLKDDLIRLALWAMAYSIRAMGADLPLAPLLEVNANMIEALRRQTRSTTTDLAQSAPSARIAV